MDIAAVNGLKVVEDCARLLGRHWISRCPGVRPARKPGVSATQDVSVFIPENLGACGDGGMIVLKQHGGC